MNEKFQIIPGESVGPFKLGMSREEVQSINRSPIKSYYAQSWSKHRTDSFELLGIQCSYDESEKLDEIVAFMKIEHNTVSFFLEGECFNAYSMSDVKKVIPIISDENVVESDWGFELPQSGIMFGADISESEDKRLEFISIKKRIRNP